MWTQPVPDLPADFVLEPHVEFDFGVGLAERDVLAVHYQRSAIEPRVLCFEPVELRALESRDLFVLGKAARFGKRLRQLGRDDENLVVRNLDRRIIKIRMNRDAQIRRQRPRCRRPDHEKNILAGECRIDLRRIGLQRKLYVNRRRRVLLVFDLGLGERGLVVDAPVDRTQAFVDVAAFEKSCRTSRAVDDSYSGDIVRYGVSHSPRMPSRWKSRVWPFIAVERARGRCGETSRPE